MKCKWNEKLFYTSKQILKLLHLPKYLKKTDDEVELYKQPEIKTTKYCLSTPQWICKTPLELHDLKAEFITGEAIFKTMEHFTSRIKCFYQYNSTIFM